MESLLLTPQEPGAVEPTSEAIVSRLYRIEERRYAGGTDEWGDPIPGDRGPMNLVLSSHDVARTTPKGWRLMSGRFVLREATRRWACPTVEEALESFQARKRRQSSILLARAAAALQAGRAAKRLRDKILGSSATAPATGIQEFTSCDLQDGVKIEAHPLLRTPWPLPTTSASIGQQP